MENKLSKNQNRLWIIINYSSLIALLLFFYTGKLFQWPVIVILLMIASIIMLFVSFLKSFIKTNFWKMVHTSNGNLDEREKQVVLNALKYSYSIFTVICLVIIYIFVIVKPAFIDVVVAGGLIYLAHTLPATIVGWKEAYFAVENK